MEYFRLLPKINYDVKNYTIRNLFQKFDFTEAISDKYLYNYTLKDEENLETVSFDIYQDPIYWWLLAIINDISDVIFDLPLSTEILQRIARDQSMVNDVLDLELFSINYDILEKENDKKRTIKVLKPQYLNEVIVNIIRKS